MTRSASLSAVEQPVELLGLVGAVGVHLADHVVAPIQAQAKPAGRPRRGRPSPARCRTCTGGSAAASPSAMAPVPSGESSSTISTSTVGGHAAAARRSRRCFGLVVGGHTRRPDRRCSSAASVGYGLRHWRRGRGRRHGRRPVTARPATASLCATRRRPGVTPPRSPTVSTSTSWVRRSRAGHHRAVGRGSRPRCRWWWRRRSSGRSRSPAARVMRELLVDLVGVDEAGVARLHGEQLGAVLDLRRRARRRRRCRSRSRRPAGRRRSAAARSGCRSACRGRSGRAGPGPRARPSDQAAEGDVLAEGDRVPLGVPLPRAGHGVPHDALVEHVVRVRRRRSRPPGSARRRRRPPRMPRR